MNTTKRDIIDDVIRIEGDYVNDPAHYDSATNKGRDMTIPDSKGSPLAS